MKPWSKDEMLEQVINLFHQGCSVNLGIGLPTAIPEILAARNARGPVNDVLDIFIQSENGVLGVAGRPAPGDESPTLINAGKETISIRPGASCFDRALSFGMIRGGHIDFCILGGMEVDAEGSLANWIVPGQKVTGMGGAMDLVHGAKQVVVVMTYFNKAGETKLKSKCTLPLTGMNCVDLVVTELGMFAPGSGRFKIRKLAPGVAIDDLKIASSLITMDELHEPAPY